MIRLAWRQFRTQALIAVGGVILLAAVIAATRPHLTSLYDTNVANCATRDNCETATRAFLQTDRDLRGWLDILVVVVPGLLGAFWGAPLVARELETGTFRLAWTQSITRSRWLGVKLGMVGLCSMAVAGLASLMVSSWATRLDQVGEDRFGVFDMRGIVPIGYAAYAVMLGVLIGVIMRRAVPAMATTLVVFVSTRLAFVHLIRPRLMTAVVQEVALEPTRMGFGSRDGGPMTIQPEPPHLPNAWFQSIHIVDRAGHALSADAVSTACPDLASMGPPTEEGTRSAGPVPDQVKHGLEDCITKLGNTYHQVVNYQPANRYWTFQWIELGIFLGASLLVAGACFWWVRRRLR